MLKLFTRLIAPDRCILCNDEGSGVCVDCQNHSLTKRTSSCYLCNAVTHDERICARCQWRTPLRRCTPLWRLDVSAETVVYGFKYEGREDVARSIAAAIKATPLSFYDIITFVPDTPQRKRQRGYVAPQLIARELSRITRKPYVELLERTRHIPQVGAGKQARWRQVKDNFEAKNLEVIHGQRILLIDDVITTGATVTECAKTIKRAGSGPIYAVAVAKK